jgi:hypothetical protein
MRQISVRLEGGASMQRQYWLTAVLLSGVLAVPAQAQVQLQWKLNQGDKFFLETTGTTKQTMKIMGNPIEQEFNTTTVDSYKVVKKAPDQIVLEKRIESMKVKATGPGAEAADQSARKAKGAVFTLTLDPRTNTITKVEGVTEFVKKAYSDNPLLQQTMAATLNEDTLREEQQNILTGYLFDKPVHKGDKWTRKSKIPMGPIGSLSSQGDFTYQGKSASPNQDLDKIVAVWKLTYAPPPKNKGGLPFEIVKGDFKTAHGTGSYYFDSRVGKLARLERKYNMKGTLTMSAMGQQLEMEMEMDQASTVRLLDKAPASE